MVGPGLQKFTSPVWARMFRAWGYPDHFYLVVGAIERNCRNRSADFTDGRAERARADGGDDRRRHHADHGRLLALLNDLAAERRYLTRVPVRADGRLLLIDLADVDWMSAADNYVTLHAAGREYLVRDTMARLERQLDPATFIRIHRCAIVQIGRVREVLPEVHGDFGVVLKDGTRLTLSRTYRSKLEQALGRQL